MQSMTVEEKAGLIENEAAGYLKSRYDDVFTPVSYTGVKFAYGFNTVKFRSSRFGGGIFTVRVYEDNGVFTFSDDYFRLYMKDEADKLISAAVKKHIKKFTVDVGFYAGELPAIAAEKPSFADYVKTGQCLADIKIYPAGSCGDVNEEETVKSIEETGVTGNCRFIYLRDPGNGETPGEIYNRHPECIEGISDYLLGKEK